MVSGLFVLCATVLAVLRGPLAGAVGPVVRCEPCHPGALQHCQPVPPHCAELVQEKHCGCCLTCAVPEGAPCGVYRERCGSGLLCRASSEEPRPLQALLMGRGVCARAASASLQPAPGNSSNSNEDKLPDNPDVQAPSNSERMLFNNPQAQIDLIRKEKAKNTQRFKVDYDTQSTDTLNIFSESKQDLEYGPCRREMESILNRLKAMNILSPTGFQIPNCDKKGFYKKKQCHPSNGRKRGNCWCVDKYGQPLPGYDVNNNCFNLESK